ncbi:MAG: hypothetical protein GJT30_06175 [Geobacter sp.]|nr:hypothetical protein [Geobacter sp.]
MAIQGISEGTPQGLLAGQAGQGLTPQQSGGSTILPQQAVAASLSYSVTISAQARDLAAGSAATTTSGSAASVTGSPKGSGASGPQECQTCSNRKYQDVSNDATVSFQSPTRLSPGAAETMVRAHEQQHVNHEQVRAQESDREVVSQNVAIHYAICPECGRPYVSGGTTTTVTKAQAQPGAEANSSPSSSAGGAVDLLA